MIASHDASCYVYYRVRADQLSNARRAVAAILAELRQKTGVQGCLSQRCLSQRCLSQRCLTQRRENARAVDARAVAAPTWMETYAGIGDPAAFEQLLTAAVSRHDLQQWLPEGTLRAIEWFEPMDVQECASR